MWAWVGPAFNVTIWDVLINPEYQVRCSPREKGAEALPEGAWGD